MDWENLQRPGFSPDYEEQRYERMDLAYERSDWIPTAGAQALIRNNRPLLAYIGGKPARFTSKDHNFVAGETVEKQIIVINNSRVPVTLRLLVVAGPAPADSRSKQGYCGDRPAGADTAALRPAGGSQARRVQAERKRGIQTPARRRKTSSRSMSFRAGRSRVPRSRSRCSTPRARRRSCSRVWVSTVTLWMRRRTWRRTKC